MKPSLLFSVIALGAALPGFGHAPAPGSADAGAKRLVHAAHHRLAATEEAEELFCVWGFWRHGDVPQWDAERRLMYSTDLYTDKDGKQIYAEHLQHLSQDGMQLTLYTRSAVCGVAGFSYAKDVQRAVEPYVFNNDEEGYSQTVWKLAPGTNDLLAVYHRQRTADAAGDRREQPLWLKPMPYSAEKAPLVKFRERSNEKLGVYMEPNPVGNPRYALSPDGKHLVYAHENASGAWSYYFTIYTLEGDTWVEEPKRKFFGSRACALDYRLTEQGIAGMLLDDELELRIPLFISYTGSDDGLWYRGERSEHAYPLHEAAREGQVEVVRALLTSRLIDPGEVNEQGQSADRLTDNAEIISLIRAAHEAYTKIPPTSKSTEGLKK